jgi:hypothetical protein
MSTQKTLTNLAQSVSLLMLWKNTAALDGKRLLVETRAMARRLPSFQWLAARGACDGQGSGASSSPAC